MLSKSQDRPPGPPKAKRQQVVLDLDTKVEIYTNLSQSASMINYLRRYFAAQIVLNFGGSEFLLYIYLLMAM